MIVIKSINITMDDGLYDSIMNCDVDMRQDLFANIVLAAGNTMFKGFG